MTSPSRELLRPPTSDHALRAAAEAPPKPREEVEKEEEETPAAPARAHPAATPSPHQPSPVAARPPASSPCRRPLRQVRTCPYQMTMLTRMGRKRQSHYLVTHRACCWRDGMFLHSALCTLPPHLTPSVISGSAHQKGAGAHTSWFHVERVSSAAAPARSPRSVGSGILP